MSRCFYLFSVFCVFTASILNARVLNAQDRGGVPTTAPDFAGRALVLDIDARVLEESNIIVWNEKHQKLTIPGNSVGIQLVGANLIVAVQFTPFLRPNANVLVAVVQLWVSDQDRGVSYYTSLQTISIEFDEPVYFFPLGQQLNSSSIEIIITVNQYIEDSADAVAETGNDR